MKFGIGVVIAIVMQVSAFVWWTAQQAQTIETLKTEVAQLTSEMTVARQINKERDIADMKKSIEEQYMWLTEIDKDIEDLIDFAEFTENKWADSYATDDTYERKWGNKPPQE